jgi:hypothetical protein
VIQNNKPETGSYKNNNPETESCNNNKPETAEQQLMMIKLRETRKYKDRQ